MSIEPVGIIVCAHLGPDHTLHPMAVKQQTSPWVADTSFLVTMDDDIDLFLRTLLGGKPVPTVRRVGTSIPVALPVPCMWAQATVYALPKRYACMVFYGLSSPESQRPTRLSPDKYHHVLAAASVPFVHNLHMSLIVPRGTTALDCCAVPLLSVPRWAWLWEDVRNILETGRSAYTTDGHPVAQGINVPAGFHHRCTCNLSEEAIVLVLYGTPTRWCVVMVGEFTSTCRGHTWLARQIRRLDLDPMHLWRDPGGDLGRRPCGGTVRASTSE